MMHQSKKASLTEAIANTALGFLFALLVTALICKLYGIPMAWSNNFIITGWMTVISIARSYLVRRMWNAEFWKTWFTKKETNGN